MKCKFSSEYADEHDSGPRRGKKRIYHRHTNHQIQEMERFFKVCPLPDGKARLELSKQLNLEPRQIKFWFQNRRTQLKAQQDRHTNSSIRTQNQQLKAENLVLRETIKAALCAKCGGPMHQTDNQQLRKLNSSLKKEVSALATKYLPSFATSIPSTSSPDPGVTTPNAFDRAQGPSVAVIASRPLGLSDTEKIMVVELAVSAMEELVEVAQSGKPLWLLDSQTDIELLNLKYYMERFPQLIGPTPSELKIEATRETDLVHMNASSLVEMLMDENRWNNMFPSIISRALTIEVLSNEAASNFDDGSIQLMYAEFQMPTPLVPTREVYFLRYCRKMDHLWVVVDVSVDSLRGNPPPALLRCRKRPSGCVIEETNNGYSKVTWVEHVEVDQRGVHPSYQMLVSSGMGFGARRWLPTLQRQCERIASLLTSNNITVRATVGHAMLSNSNLEGRRSVLRLAERMTNEFCKELSGSPLHNWITLSGSEVDAACRVVIRKSLEFPGRPPSILLTAATSLWLPVPPIPLFDFLRDESCRTKWDVLSSMGRVKTMLHIRTGQDAGNNVSVLHAINSNQTNMILQDCCTNKGCLLLVYAPIDTETMSNILKGGDSKNVLPLPSGFAILPDGPPLPHPQQIFHKSITSSTSSCGSLLTIAFQILVDNLPTNKLSSKSLATIDNLISSTIDRIKGVLSSNNT